jgi:hypothetical protein
MLRIYFCVRHIPRNDRSVLPEQNNYDNCFSYKKQNRPKYWAMSSERDSFAKGKFSTFAKGFLLHKLLLKVNYSPLRVKKSRSHDMGHCWLYVAL